MNVTPNLPVFVVQSLILACFANYYSEQTHLELDGNFLSTEIVER